MDFCEPGTVTVSIKATFFPSSERIGDVRILPLGTVVVLYENRKFGRKPGQSGLFPPTYKLFKATIEGCPPVAPGTLSAKMT